MDGGLQTEPQLCILHSLSAVTLLPPFTTLDPLLVRYTSSSSSLPLASLHPLSLLYHAYHPSHITPLSLPTTTAHLNSFTPHPTPFSSLPHSLISSSPFTPLTLYPTFPPIPTLPPIPLPQGLQAMTPISPLQPDSFPESPL
jgi:hypothetical protein